MGRLFGTDGIRGIVNAELDCALVSRVAQALGMIKRREKGGKPLFLVGRDTRLSGAMLVSAFSAGLASVGADVVLIGVVPTPAAAFLARRLGADAGVILTASHNPYMYNGIKIFGGDGFKLTDAEEAEIETIVLEGSEPVIPALYEDIGDITSDPDAADAYVDHLTGSVGRLDGLRIAVDCANGSACATAEKIFSRTGADVSYLFREPDGVNINSGCGSLHIGALGEYVRANGLDLGVAFDGDADRCLAVDENGELIDGDMIMAMLAGNLKREGRLPRDTFVSTVMSNLGLFKFAEESGLRCFATKVGDRYVLEAMLRDGFMLGGEQSGHIVFLEYTTTGDGQLTALLLAETLAASGKKASELKSVIRVYPQVAVNIEATPEMKARLSDPEVKSFIDLESERLEGDGRVLVRPSGTEPLVRIMIEGRDREKIEELAHECAEALAMMLK